MTVPKPPKLWNATDMEPSKPPRLIAAVARLDTKPAKKRRAAAIRQHRQADAWRRQQKTTAESRQISTRRDNPDDHPIHLGAAQPPARQ